MKATIFALLAASLVSAQDFNGVPKCAQDCLAKAIPEAGCAIEDTACTCSESTQAKLRSLAAPCLLRECSPDELIEAQQGGAAACEAYSSASAASASASGTASDEGTTGIMSILPTDILPPVPSPTTPGVPSITTISSIVTPPGNNNTTRTTSSEDSNETGGSGGGGNEGGDNQETTTSTDAAPMATVGLVAALLAAAVAI